ncbi:MAG: ABC transporter substrate-binding protein [Dehalococcoidia bacterium]|nr:ABC transporter substrate-binding protein [Dehalococcoidia bacterium]
MANALLWFSQPFLLTLVVNQRINDQISVTRQRGIFCARLKEVATMLLRRGKMAVALSVLAGGMLSVACATPQAAPPPAGGGSNEVKAGGILRFSYHTDPVYLDPIRKNVSDMEMITGGTYGMLLRYKLGKEQGYTSTVLQSYLAEKWEVSPDGGTYTFNLRKGVMNENKAPLNGSEFTSKDVKFNLERYRDDRQSTAKYMVEEIKSIETPDPYTVKVIMNGPFAPFLTYAGNTELLMVPQALVEAGLSEKQAIGYGPYRFESGKEGSVFKMKKNPDFFLKDEKGRSLPYLDGYDMYIIPDEAAQVAAFVAGQVDICARCLPGSSPLLDTLKQGAKDATIVELLDAGGDKIYISQQWEPGKDIRVRQAIQAAINPKAFIDALSKGKAQLNIAGIGPAWGDWSLPAAEIGKYYAADPAKARQLLKDAGRENLPVEIMWTPASGQGFRLWGEMLVSQLKAAGFDPKLDTVENAVAFDRKRKAEFHLHIFGGSFRPDPDGNIYATFKCGSSLNYSKACDPQLDPLLEKQRSITDVTERKKAVHDALRMINERAIGFLQPYSDHTAYYWRPYVKGYYPHMYWGFGLKTLETWLDK